MKLPFKLRRVLKWLLLTVTAFISVFFILHIIFPLRIDKNYSQSVIAADGTVLHAFLSTDDKWRMYAELSEINPTLKKALIYKEDKYFYYHFGVNPFAIVRAAFNNLLHLKKTSGASTITMQVARLIYPAKRTYLNKATEMFRAVQLEMAFSKDEILQLYLNLAPYGGNIEGVKAASLLYFGHLPANVNLSQAVMLTIIPNRPTSLKPGKNNLKLITERNKWLARFKEDKLFPDNEITDAINEPLFISRSAAPAELPHLSLRLKNKFPGKPNIYTTISGPVQKKSEAIVYNYMQRLKQQNINNAAVIVVDNKTHTVKAYVGSPDFSDAEHAGQVDGVAAVRSPGSTLKPLVYAIAMDKGIITPKTMLEDVPVNFSGYAPENFNKKFNGKVTAEKALAFSLNVPAVELLNEVTVPLFVSKLKEASFNTAVKNERKMGLSMILGGCGVKLEELTSLFSAFANKGKFYQLRFLKGESDTVFKQLISESAAFMISEILTELVRPDLPNNYQSSMHVPKIAWKTGTSYGRRDAWSIGFNMEYTIGVWIGNFNGQGVPELTGADMATPLLFNLFNSIDYNSSNEWFVPPAELDFRLVCSESGLPVGDFCSATVTDYFIPKISGYRKCSHLAEVAVSTDEKISYCTQCMPVTGYKKNLYPNLSPPLISYYKTNHIEFKEIPAHNPSCTRVFSENPPRITSPVNGKEYLEEKGEELQLSCNVNDDVQWVYWYINNTFYKKAKAHENIFFTPAEGTIKISCSDDKGRNTNVEVRVRLM